MHNQNIQCDTVWSLLTLIPSVKNIFFAWCGNFIYVCKCQGPRNGIGCSQRPPLPPFQWGKILMRLLNLLLLVYSPQVQCYCADSRCSKCKQAIWYSSPSHAKFYIWGLCSCWTDRSPRHQEPQHPPCKGRNCQVDWCWPCWGPHNQDTHGHNGSKVILVQYFAPKRIWSWLMVDWGAQRCPDKACIACFMLPC